MFEKVVIIDGRAHLLGRLASVIAKELVKGQHVVVVRCEEINISGSLYRNKLKYQKFLRLRMNSNPRKGPFHLRAPSKILWRTIRGMLPHKTDRGAIALSRFRGFEGIPHPYDKKKRVVVPSALKVVRLKPGRDFCRLGDMATKVGWNYNPLVKRLEDKRRVRAETKYTVTKELSKLKAQAKEEANKQMPAEELAFLQKFNKA